ncbi:MAG: hypothetical protein GX321_00925 [Clostridiales bacterium]|nr:hypothetical protein [Clostridiales bacterium]
MKKKSHGLLRNLSLFTFVAIYLIIATILLFLESFQWETQFNVITALIPFFLLGAVIDYIISRNKQISNFYKVIAQILPAGTFVLFGISILLEILGKPPAEAVYYLGWLFISLPFFISSYYKDNHRKRLLYSLIGTGLMAVVYIFLTTITDNLIEGSGLVIYLISFLLMFYAASVFNNLFYIGTIIGGIDAAILLLLWKNPISEKSKVLGWDYDIAFNFELILLITFILCILLCFVHAIIKNKPSSK